MPDGEMTTAIAKRARVELPDTLTPEEAKQFVNVSAQNDDATATTANIITVGGVQRTVRQLQSRLARNTEERVKWADQPEKFLESEVDLDEEFTQVQQIAADDRLLTAFNEHGGFDVMLEVLQHPNPDLAAAAVRFLSEALDPDVFVDVDEAEALLEKLFRLELPALLTTFLGQVQENASDEDAEAVTGALTIVEHFLELDPPRSAGAFGGRNEKLVAWLLQRIKMQLYEENPFDYNRLYAAELLASLLQFCPTTRGRVGRDVTALEALLVALGPYRKNDPASAEEEEFACNLFNCVVSVIQDEESRAAFGKTLGLELMLRILRARRQLLPQALSVLAAAMEGSAENCKHVVERMGLKSLFGVLAAKGVKVKEAAVRHSMDENLSRCLLSLASNLRGVPHARLLNKFVEDRCEKLEIILDKYLHYSHRVTAGTAKRKNKTVAAIEEHLVLNETEQAYLDRCADGLFVMQTIARLLLKLGNCGSELLAQRIRHLLAVKNIRAADVIQVLEEFVQNLDIAALAEAEEIAEEIKVLTEEDETSRDS